MTSNDNTVAESLTPWLQSVGFQRNPFSLPFAENQPTDMFQQTYFVADELEQLMLDQEKSVAFLAPYGGGKTAARRYTQFRWEEQYPHAFITVYDNFTAVAEQLPDVKLSTHREPLLAATAESFWGCISKKPEKLLALPEVWQLWWWALLHHYLPGSLLEFRVHDVPELVSSYFEYVQRGDGKRPFRYTEQLPVILKTIDEQLKNIGFTNWFILVDEIDGEILHHVDAMAVLLRPLLNTLALYRMPFTWKFFLPHEVREVVSQSSPRLRGQLEIADILWNRGDLSKFLENRLLWASNGAYKSLVSFSTEGLPNLNESLIDLAYKHQETFGAPRSLLRLGDKLISQLNQKNIIAQEDWQQFIISLPAYMLMEEAEKKRLQNVSRDKLLEVLNGHFNLSELRELAFILSIEFENLTGENTRKSKAIGLIEYCECRQRIPHLVKAACTERSQTSLCEELFSTAA